MNHLRLLTLLILVFASALADSAAAETSTTMEYAVTNVAPARLATQRARAAAAGLDQSGLLDLTESFSPLLKSRQIDQFLVTPAFHKAVFIKYGLKPKSTRNEGRVLQLANDQYVFHSRSPEGVSFAAFFAGFSRTEINPLLFAMTRKQKHASFRFPLWLLGSTAHAGIRCSSYEMGPALKRLAVAMKDNAGQCALSFAMSGLDAQFGSLKLLFDWKGASELWEMMKDIWLRTQDVFLENVEGFFNLPPKDQAIIACEFAGSVASAAIATAGSAGASAAVSLAGMSRKIGSIAAKMQAKVRALPKGAGRALMAADTAAAVTSTTKQALDKMDCIPSMYGPSPTDASQGPTRAAQ